MMTLVFELHTYSLKNLDLDRLRHLRYKNIDQNTYVHDDDQVHIKLFDEYKRKLVYYISLV